MVDNNSTNQPFGQNWGEGEAVQPPPPYPAQGQPSYDPTAAFPPPQQPSYGQNYGNASFPNQPGYPPAGYPQQSAQGYQQPGYPPQPNQPYPYQPPKKQGGGCLLIALLVIAVILIAVVLLFAFKPWESTTAAPVEQTTAQAGEETTAAAPAETDERQAENGTASPEPAPELPQELSGGWVQAGFVYEGDGPPPQRMAVYENADKVISVDYIESPIVIPELLAFEVDDPQEVGDLVCGTRQGMPACLAAAYSGFVTVTEGTRTMSIQEVADLTNQILQEWQ